MAVFAFESCSFPENNVVVNRALIRADDVTAGLCDALISGTFHMGDGGENLPVSGGDGTEFSNGE